METKTKCLRCGYSLFLSKGKMFETSCPKCGQIWKIVEENGEIFLEPVEQVTSEPVS